MLPRLWPAILSLGWILLVFSAAEALMVLFSLAAGDGHATIFAVAALVTVMVAGACILTTKGRRFELNFRDAALLTVMAWVLVPAFAALPLIADPIGLSYVDAYFEMVSAITTTGSTVMVGLDSTIPSILMWRSLVQWVGGIGIIGLAIVILPFLKIGGMQLFKLESSDRSEKILPRVRATVTAVGQIYVGLTFFCFLAYWALGMTPFDALNHAMTTIPTAGFSTHDQSFAYFDSYALEWAACVFMLLGALPFFAYLRLMRRGNWQDRIESQAVAFLIAVAALVAFFALWVHYAHEVEGATAATKSAFNIVSVITTTGYASTDYLVWGAFSSVFFFILTFVGGCTGSTAGGIKIFRFQVLYGIIKQHLHRLLWPHIISPIQYGGRTLTDEQVASVSAFVVLFFGTFAVVALILAGLGLDVETSLSGAATALANVGPGIGDVIGLAGNFATLPDSAKLVLCAAMIIGRLEIMVVFVLFVPSFYR